MNVNPKLFASIHNRLCCPVCDDGLRIGTFPFAMRCMSFRCYDFKIIMGPAYTFDTVSVTIPNGQDQTIIVSQNFHTNNVSLVMTPQHNEVTVSYFDIDWKDLINLSEKVKLYMVLS